MRIETRIGAAAGRLHPALQDLKAEDIRWFDHIAKLTGQTTVDLLSVPDDPPRAKAVPGQRLAYAAVLCTVVSVTLLTFGLVLVMTWFGEWCIAGAIIAFAVAMVTGLSAASAGRVAIERARVRAEFLAHAHKVLSDKDREIETMRRHAEHWRSAWKIQDKN